MDNIPYGYCHCGCGHKTLLASQTDSAKGYRKGQPRRYVNGHHLRGKKRPYLRPEYETGYVINPDTECWEWQYSLDSKGYGRAQIDGKSVRAHRFMYELHRGPIPNNLPLDHICVSQPPHTGTTRCVNPYHLEPVSPATNTQRGKSAKLTRHDVDAIRRLLTSNTIPGYQIARRFNVSLATISLIKHNKSWTN